MPAPIGIPIHAPESGTVTISSNGATDQYTGRGVAGETIVIRGMSYEHWLLHLNNRLVSQGQTVSEGQVIGYSGNTGFTTGPHLHWGTRPNSPDINNGYRGFVNPQQVLDAAQPAPPAPVTRPYSIEGFSPKLVRINKDTRKWGLNYDNWNAISSNPEGSASEGDIKTVVALLRHNLGASYYLEDAASASGYNTADCDDYTPPPPPEPPKPRPLPTGALPGNNTEMYDVVKLIDGYNTSNQAINHLQPPTQPVGEGRYYIFNKRFSSDKVLLALNVTNKIGSPGAWINVEDNVPDPEPEPVVPPEPPKPPTLEEIKKDWDSAVVVATPEEVPITNVPIKVPVVVGRKRIIGVDYITDLELSNSYKAFVAPISYTTLRKVKAVDLQAKRSTKTCGEGEPALYSGRVEIDGLYYLRPKFFADKGEWNVVAYIDPMTDTKNLELSDVVERQTRRDDADIDDALEDYQLEKNLHSGHYLYQLYQSIVGIFSHYRNKIKRSK